MNIFLHNHNYHRVHSPVSGWIERIEKIAGNLLLLRPWLYPKDRISEPALRNERIVMRIRDAFGAIWMLAWFDVTFAASRIQDVSGPVMEDRGGVSPEPQALSPS